LPINVGIHEPGSPPGKQVKNTLIWIDEEGQIAHRYQKLHLFDVDLRPNGPRLKESDSVEPGGEIVPPIETVTRRVGMMICFDLRFPEISLSLKRRGAGSCLSIRIHRFDWQGALGGIDACAGN
jgi:deaminated glutathione amidase